MKFEDVKLKIAEQCRMKNISAVIFDHDGTLVDSESIHADIWINVLKKYSVDFSREEYFMHHSGMPTVANAKMLTEKFALDINAGKLAGEKSMATSRYISQNSFPLNPCVMETLQELKDRGIKMAVVTGADRIGIDNTIKSYGLEAYFEVIISGEDVQNGKPAPDGYLLALEKLGYKAEDCIAVEDSENGRKSAESAGLKCYLVKY